ncbi:MAG TPA: glycerophosphodiester phosphodiesterase [Candidatus Saccharimonadales bacterium]|nr:glycerophosphodiester phosphodiesterase [Candidatus Saccharimonadales bacterium]
MNRLMIIGHRGARGLAPENTLAALKAGLDHGVDMIEFDLRVSADDVVILNHDPHVHAPDGHRLEISANTYEDLKTAKTDLTTFDEALDYLAGKVSLYIEVKPGVATEPLVKILQQRFDKGLSKKEVLLGSFSQKTLRQLHAALPDIEKIVIEKWSGVRAARRARQLNAKIIAMNQRWLWSGYVKAATRHYTLYTYTLNNPAKADKWAARGLSAVVTDYPDRFSSS